MEDIIENSVTFDSLLSEVKIRSCINYFEIFSREAKITPDAELKNKLELLRDVTSLDPVPGFLINSGIESHPV